jgi:hypothetical protein
VVIYGKKRRNLQMNFDVVVELRDEELDRVTGGQFVGGLGGYAGDRVFGGPAGFGGFGTAATPAGTGIWDAVSGPAAFSTWSGMGYNSVW